MSLNAYQRARTMTETPRHTEYRLISEITGEMMQAQAEGRVSIALIPELHRNRELWNTLSAACGTFGNRLPDNLRAAIISIAIWVDRFTSDVVAGRESIEDLILVNRSIIEGLAGDPAS